MQQQGMSSRVSPLTRELLDRDSLPLPAGLAMVGNLESPLEHHHHSASTMHGDIFGIGTTMSQNTGRRPTPELAQFRVPGVESLYLVGPFMHPDGIVNFGGRASAMRMMMDRKMYLNQSFVL